MATQDDLAAIGVNDFCFYRDYHLFLDKQDRVRKLPALHTFKCPSTYEGLLALCLPISDKEEEDIRVTLNLPCV